jgi:hypothetical protein
MEGNERYRVLKPRYLGIPEGCSYRMTGKEHWKLNHIPFAVYIGWDYARPFPAAWDRIFKRYVRFKGIVWPDEMDAFSELFKEKHPEFMSSRNIKNDMSEYGYAGCYWDYRYKRPHRLFGGGNFALFDCYPRSPKPQKRDKVFLDLVGYEMYAIKKGYANAINKRNK